MKKLLLILVLLTAATSLAQTTVVSATVKDANNTVYQNCSYSVTFVGQSTQPGPYLISGSVFQTTFGGARCDGFGNFSINLFANSLISPTPSQWQFNICDSTGKFCGQLLATISGTTQSLTTAIIPVMPILPRTTNSLPVFGLGSQVTTTNLSSFPTVNNCVKWSANGVLDDAGAACGAGGGGGAVLLAPTTSQNVAQPSAGGATPGTSLNANRFEQVRYADQFVWLQSPTGTVSVGSNTVTINAVAGINAYSAAPGGFSGNRTTHKIRVAGTGTPEVVTISATSCTGTTTGTCTVTFTAANSHGAGFTLGTATAGFQEAELDAWYVGGAVNPVTGWTIKASPYPARDQIIFYGTLYLDTPGGSIGGVHLDCEGATIQSAVSNGPMIQYGTGVSSPLKGLIDHCQFAPELGVGRAANGNQIFVWDRGQGLSMDNNTFDSYLSNADVVDTLVQVSGDQSFEFGGNDAAGPPTFCDATWCGPLIYGDGTGSGAIGDIHDNTFSGGTANGNWGSAILWISGNGLTIHHNTFQNWMKYPWKYGGGLQDMTNNCANYYEGNPNAINPDFGVAGFSVNTGPQYTGNHIYNQDCTERGGSTVHQFIYSGNGVAGTNKYSYYIVGCKAGKCTKPLYIGEADTDGSTAFNVLYLPFNATTYDVLRTGPQVGNDADTAPYGVGNWAVATGVVCASAPCTFHETFAAPTSYTLYAGGSYIPAATDFTYWPVPFFMNVSNVGTPNIYVGPALYGLVSTDPHISYVSYYDAIWTSGNLPSGGGVGNPITGSRVLDLAAVNTSNSVNGTSGGWIIPPYQQANLPMVGHKGKINFANINYQTGSSHDSCWFTFYDSNSAKTFATPSHQPGFDANDTCIGFDNDPTRLAVMGGANSITFYVGHVFDSGTSYKARLTASALDLPTGSCFSINGVCQNGTPATPDNSIQIGVSGGFTSAPGFTSDASGNVLIPGTLGLTGQLNGTTAVFSTSVTAPSFIGSGPNATLLVSTASATETGGCSGQSAISVSSVTGKWQSCVPTVKGGDGLFHDFLPSTILQVVPQVATPSANTTYSYAGHPELGSGAELGNGFLQIISYKRVSNVVTLNGYNKLNLVNTGIENSFDVVGFNDALNLNTDRSAISIPVTSATNGAGAAVVYTSSASALPTTAGNGQYAVNAFVAVTGATTTSGSLNCNFTGQITALTGTTFTMTNPLGTVAGTCTGGFSQIANGITSSAKSGSTLTYTMASTITSPAYRVGAQANVVNVTGPTNYNILGVITAVTSNTFSMLDPLGSGAIAGGTGGQAIATSTVGVYRNTALSNIGTDCFQASWTFSGSPAIVPSCTNVNGGLNSPVVVYTQPGNADPDIDDHVGCTTSCPDGVAASTTGTIQPPVTGFQPKLRAGLLMWQNALEGNATDFNSIQSSSPDPATIGSIRLADSDPQCYKDPNATAYASGLTTPAGRHACLNGMLEISTDMGPRFTFATRGSFPGFTGGIEVPDSVWIDGSTSGSMRFQATAAVGSNHKITIPLLTQDTTLPQLVGSGTVTLANGAISATTCATAVNTTVSGMLSTDRAEVSFNAAPTGAYLTGLIIQAPDVAAGSFNVRVCNPTSGSLTPPAATLNYQVIR